MTFKTFLYATLLSTALLTSGAQDLFASGGDAETPYALVDQSKDGLLTALFDPHHFDHSSYIEPVMCSLDLEGVQDFFRQIVNFSQDPAHSDILLESEKKALQPWSVIALDVWEHNPYFEEIYALFLQQENFILQDLQHLSPVERWGYLRSVPSIAQDPERYGAQYKLLLLFQYLNQPLLRFPEQVLRTIVQFIVLSRNTPMAFLLAEKYKENPAMRRYTCDAFMTTIDIHNFQWIFQFITEKYSSIFPQNLTHLHLACAYGKTDVARKLLQDDSAILSQKDDREQNALHYACSCRNPLSAKMLIQFAKDHGNLDFLKNKNKFGRTALHTATLYNNPGALIDLIDDDFPLLYMQDNKGATALHYAFGMGNLNIAMMLMEKDYDRPDDSTLLFIEDNQGKTAIDIAFDDYMTHMLEPFGPNGMYVNALEEDLQAKIRERLRNPPAPLEFSRYYINQHPPISD